MSGPCHCFPLLPFPLADQSGTSRAETHFLVLPQVMAVNGVSHHIVEDDLAGCTAVLQWLAYVPAVLGSHPPTMHSSDPVNRPISYTPGPSEALKPSRCPPRILYLGWKASDALQRIKRGGAHATAS